MVGNVSAVPGEIVCVRESAQVDGNAEREPVAHLGDCDLGARPVDPDPEGAGPESAGARIRLRDDGALGVFEKREVRGLALGKLRKRGRTRSGLGDGEAAGGLLLRACRLAAAETVVARRGLCPSAAARPTIPVALPGLETTPLDGAHTCRRIRRPLHGAAGE
jgi:hypothetical protein